MLFVSCLLLGIFYYLLPHYIWIFVIFLWVRNTKVNQKDPVLHSIGNKKLGTNLWYCWHAFISLRAFVVIIRACPKQVLPQSSSQLHYDTNIHTHNSNFGDYMGNAKKYVAICIPKGFRVLQKKLFQSYMYRVFVYIILHETTGHIHQIPGHPLRVLSYRQKTKEGLHQVLLGSWGKHRNTAFSCVFGCWKREEPSSFSSWKV